MAFKPQRLEVLAFAGGFTLWIYQSDDTTEEIGSPGYFNDAANTLRKGDMILMSLTPGGGAVVSGISGVVNNSGGIVIVRFMCILPPVPVYGE